MTAEIQRAHTRDETPDLHRWNLVDDWDGTLQEAITTTELLHTASEVGPGPSPCWTHQHPSPAGRRHSEGTKREGEPHGTQGPS